MLAVALIIRRTANDVTGGLFPPSVCSYLVISPVFHPEQPPPPYSSTPTITVLLPLFSFCFSMFSLLHHTPLPPPPPHPSLLVFFPPDCGPSSTHSLSVSYHPSSSLPHTLPLYLVEVETFARIPCRRALSFCPCWSPEGNTTPPPLPPVVPRLPITFLLLLLLLTECV